MHLWILGWEKGLNAALTNLRISEIKITLTEFTKWII